MNPSPEPTIIDVTRYAEIMAHLRYFPADKHGEVIARLGIRRRDWDAAAARWKSVRDAERISGQLEVTIRFGRIMADTQAMLQAKQPPIESLGPLPGPDGEALAHADAPKRKSAVPEKAPEGAGSASPAVVTLPVALLDPAARDVPTRWGSNTPSYVSAELRAAAEARVAPPLPAPDAPPPPRPALHYPSPVSAPLPPVPAACSTPSPPIVRAKPSSVSSLAGTANVDMSAIVAAAQQGALPFARLPSSVPGTAAEVRSRPVGSGTVEANINAAVADERSLLPFVPSPSSAARTAEAPEKRSAAEVRPRAVGSGTVEADVNAAVANERSALPFAHVERPGPGPAEAGEDFDLSLLPLETYASVSGALARGDSREATLRRYGLTGEAFEILAKAWAQRFRREPHLLDKFKELARSCATAGGEARAGVKG
jgi:hypothetical protein